MCIFYEEVKKFLNKTIVFGLFLSFIYIQTCRNIILYDINMINISSST